ncbi:MAG: deoB [Haloplasmataceae bacterium]|jgi:phosphopentomutase|nr:deoB [Haloplasmataceae bacterium]
MKYKRIFLIVLDSLGCGELPDSQQYNDIGANTIKHISESLTLSLPNLQKFGYGNLTEIKNVNPTKETIAYYTKMMEKSVGKDTMTGHWEMMGLEVPNPFQTFTDTGFPQELIKELEEKSERKIIGNKAASGTEILVELGEEHMATGALIVYTSADSVLQIAAHEEVVPLDELYRICSIAREMTLRDEYKVGRVIARPFLGTNKDNFKRTPNRHDYALKPFAKTVLNYLKEKGLDVISIGKINDIYDGEGITTAFKSISNANGLDIFLKRMDEKFTGLCFANLVDFDALYGHRRDPLGYGQAINEFDTYLGQIENKLHDDDLLILTADHGNDPVHHGTDHTREFVPLLVYNKQFKYPGKLPIRKTFADIGATIADNFDVDKPLIGNSFYKDLK